MKIKDFLCNYKTLSEPTKASVWFVVSNILIRGISFFTLPLFSRLLTEEQYGAVSVYGSWSQLISIFTTLTLWGGVLNVGLSKYVGKEDELISSFQGLGTTLTIAVFALLLPLTHFLAPLMGISKVMMPIMLVDILSVLPYNIWATRQRYLYRYKTLIALAITSSVLNPVLGFILVMNTEHKAEAKVISGVLIQMLIGITFFVINYKNGKRFFNREFWRYAWKFSIVLVPYYLSLQVLNHSDRIMIDRMCGEGDAGIYSVAYNFAMLLGLVTSGITSSLVPFIYKKMKTNEERVLQKCSSAVVLLVAVITIGVICVVPDLFIFMLPKGYYRALYVIPPVTLGAFFVFIYPLFTTVEMYYEDNKYITIGSVIAAITNVVLNYIFINIIGFIAAAYTTLFCYFLLSAIHYWLMLLVQKKHESNIVIYDVKKILVICIATTVFGLGIMLVYERYLIRWTIVGLLLIIMAIKRDWIKKNIVSLIK